MTKRTLPWPYCSLWDTTSCNGHSWTATALYCKQSRRSASADVESRKKCKTRLRYVSFPLCNMLRLVHSTAPRYNPTVSWLKLKLGSSIFATPLLTLRSPACRRPACHPQRRPARGAGRTSGRSPPHPVLAPGRCLRDVGNFTHQSLAYSLHAAVLFGSTMHALPCSLSVFAFHLGVRRGAHSNIASAMIFWSSSVVGAPLIRHSCEKRLQKAKKDDHEQRSAC